MPAVSVLLVAEPSISSVPPTDTVVVPETHLTVTVYPDPILAAAPVVIP